MKDGSDYRRVLHYTLIEAENNLRWADKAYLASFLKWWGDELEKQAWIEAIDGENDQAGRRWQER